MPIVINELETLDDEAPEQDQSEQTSDDGALLSLLENQQTQKHWQLLAERQARLSYD